MIEDLQTWQWLASDAGEAAINAIPKSLTPSSLTSLRKKLSQEQVRVASEASQSRFKAMKKLDEDFASRLIADVPAVEMASSASASMYKASKIASLLGQTARIADLCSGIGGDSWGFIEAGLGPIGVDVCPVRSWMYQYNTGCESIAGDAVEHCPQNIEAFHLDPARRSSTGKRTMQVDDYLPGVEAWRSLIHKCPSGAIKLNPGIDPEILPTAQVEVISEAGRLTQALLWTGKLAGKQSRFATLLTKENGVTSIEGEPDRPDSSSAVQEFLGTLDPSLERADLVGEILNQTHTLLVHPGTGMVTANEPMWHPMIRWHRVVEIMNWNRKKVKAVLRDLNAGIVEVRTRAGIINPDQEQRYLRGSGELNQYTVFVYRIDQRVHCIVAERIKS